MCGIVGYIGDRKAFPILVNGLKRLEYRGYDSSGVALAQNGEIAVYKKQGMVVAMEEHALANDTSGSTGIAHTRWATHGQPSDENAHPHISNSGDLVLVHNGIIENYQTQTRRGVRKKRKKINLPRHCKKIAGYKKREMNVEE